MRSLFPFLFSFATLLGGVVAASHPSIMIPLSDDSWHHGLRRRQEMQHPITLQKTEHLVWGSAAGSGQNFFVNMTIEASDDEHIISMERFVGELKSVDCSSDILMTFTSEDTYQHAISEWTWVNNHENHTIILIANYPGCSDENIREPWVVSSVLYDHPNLGVYLNATKKAWAQAISAYEVDFGRHGPEPPSIAKRGGGPFGAIGKTIAEKAHDLNKDIQKTVNTAGTTITTPAQQAVAATKQVAKQAPKQIAGTATTVVNEVADIMQKAEADIVEGLTKANVIIKFAKNIPKTLELPAGFLSPGMPGVSFSCEGCSTAGTFHLSGKSTKKRNAQPLIHFDFTQKGMKLLLKALKIEVEGKIASLEKEFDILTFPAEPLSIVIPRFLNIGISAVVALATSLNSDGRMSVTSGATAKLPDSSGASLKWQPKTPDSLDKVKTIGARGGGPVIPGKAGEWLKETIGSWEPELEALTSKVEGAVKAAFEAHPSFKINFGLELMDNGFNAAFQVKVPSFNLTTTPNSEPCEDPNMEKHKHSIHLGKKIGIDIGVDVTWMKETLFTHTLFNKPFKTFADECYAVNQDLASKPDTGTSNAKDAPTSAVEKSPVTGETSAKAGVATSETTEA